MHISSNYFPPKSRGRGQLPNLVILLFMERKNVKTGFLFFSTGADGHDGHLTINQAKPMHVAVRSGAIEWMDRCDGPFK